MDDTLRDQSRPVATSRDNDFTLSLDEVSERYAQAGHARTIRTLQRYCASGHLDAQKVATTTGDKYLVTPQSVARHIAQIEELKALDMVATDRDASRPVATTVVQEQSHSNDSTKGRPAATGESDVSRHVVLLEKRIEEKDDVIGLLKTQLVAKDDQIKNLNQRFSDTQSLLGAMQRMLAPLLGQADPFKAAQSREASDAPCQTDRNVDPRSASNLDPSIA